MINNLQLVELTILAMVIFSKYVKLSGKIKRKIVRQYLDEFHVFITDEDIDNFLDLFEQGSKNVDLRIDLLGEN